MIAVKTVVSFLREQSTSLKEVIFALFDPRTLEDYGAALEKAAGNLS
jgi:hypothetical protein